MLSSKNIILIAGGIVALGAAIATPFIMRKRAARKAADIMLAEIKKDIDDINKDKE